MTLLQGSEWVIFVAEWEQCRVLVSFLWMLLQGAASCKEHDAVLASMSWLRPLITLAFCPTFCPGAQGDVLFN